MAKVIKHKDQRVAVLIDTQNLYHSAKNLYKSKVNFAGVLEAAVGGRKLIRALSYVVNTESGEEQPFFEALEKIGIEIKTKDLQIFYGGAKKADWDVGLAVDAIKLSSKVDAIVLATGDGVGRAAPDDRHPGRKRSCDSAVGRALQRLQRRTRLHCAG